MGIIRDSFVIFKNWVDAIEKLPAKYQLECFKALTHYGLSGAKPDGLSPIADALITSFSVGMENNIIRYNASVANGKKGGAPKGNQNARKNNKTEDKTIKNNLKQPKTIKNNLNDNVNVNVNDNVNDEKLVNKTIFDNYDDSCACGRVGVKTEQERAPFVKYFSEFFDWCFKEDFKEIGFEVIDTIIEALNQSKTKKGLLFKSQKYTWLDFAKLIAHINNDAFRSIVGQLAFNQEIKHRPIYILGCIVYAANNKQTKITEHEINTFMESLKDI